MRPTFYRENPRSMIVEPLASPNVFLWDRPKGFADRFKQEKVFKGFSFCGKTKQHLKKKMEFYGHDVKPYDFLTHFFFFKLLLFELF